MRYRYVVAMLLVLEVLLAMAIWAMVWYGYSCDTVITAAFFLAATVPAALFLLIAALLVATLAWMVPELWKDLNDNPEDLRQEAA